MNDDKTNQSLLHDSIVHLESESTEYSVPLQDVLREAATGALELLFQRPDNPPRTVILPLDRRGTVIGELSISQVPDYLILTRDSCSQLVDRRSALVTSAHSGYRSRSGHSFLTLLYASDADKERILPVQVNGKDFVPPDTRYGFWGCWAFWAEGQPVQYRVRPEDIFVRQGEFRRWRLESFYPRAKKSAARDKSGQISQENSLLDPRISDDHKSHALLVMCEAAFVLWAHESVIFDNPITFPKEHEVITWLLDHSDPGTFTKTSAKEATRLIKPAFARRRDAMG